MAESLNTPSEKAGLPPGSLVHVGKAAAMAGQVMLVKYSADRVEEHPVATLDDIICRHETGTSLWVHCQGLDMVDLLAAIGQRYDIHPLVLEDILNTHQRPKFEEYEHYCFIVLKTLGCKGALTVHHEQVALLLLDDILFTFREQADGLFDSLKQRLFHGKSRMRTMGVDYLAYVIMDAVVDNYFAVSDVMEDAIEAAEISLLDRPQPQTFATIQLIKRELIYIRKAIVPLREVLLAIQRSESTLIQDKTQLFFRDVFDHTLRVIDTMDSLRDLINGMLDIYLSSVSNRMNEVVKVLTVFATIFTPLTFLVGVYGMNFDYMPELHYRWAYPALWVLFFLVPAVLLFLFKKKRWL